MGSVGAGRNNGTITTQVISSLSYDMPELTEKAKKMDIPIFRVNRDGKYEISSKSGYGFMYKGIPIFLQKDGSTYTYNIYGNSVGSLRGIENERTFKAASENTQNLDRIVQVMNHQQGNSTILENAKERYDFINSHFNATRKELDAHMKEWDAKQRKKK